MLSQHLDVHCLPSPQVHKLPQVQEKRHLIGHRAPDIDRHQVNQDTP